MRPTTVLTVVATLALSGGAQAEIEGELHAGWNSEYIWRGIDQGGASMSEFGLDLSTEFQGFDLSAGVWYATVNGSGSFDEVDWYAGISKDLTLGPVEGTLSAGYIYYDFPNGGAGYLEEIYLGASTQVWILDLGFTYYWGIDGVDNDGYSEFSVGYSRELSEKFTFNGNWTLAFDWDTQDLHHYGSTWSLDYAWNDVLTISPYIAYTIAEDGAETGALAISSSQGDEIFGGIILTAGF